MESYIKKGAEQTISCVVKNNGVRAISSYTISYSYGSESGNTTITEKLPAGASMIYTLPITVAPTTLGKYTLTVTVQPDDESDDVKGNNSVSGKQVVYDATYPRTMMIEQFTGQKCGNCPAGSNLMKSTLAAYEDKLVWAAHHYGYGDDALSVSKSSSYTAFFNDGGATYAPAMMIDRAQIPTFDDPGPAFFTGQLTAAVVKTASEVPAFVTVNMNRTYNAESRTMNLTVTGNTLMPMENARMNVFVVQDSLIATQSGGGSNYVHNRAVREILTATWGDGITFDADGNYSMEFSYVIPDSIESISSSYKNIKFGCVPENMEVQAFVTEYNSDVNDRQVQNAAKVSMVPGEEAASIRLKAGEAVEPVTKVMYRK